MGYQYDETTGGMKPIQGGPAAQKAFSQNALIDSKMANIDQAADSLVNVANELKNHPGLAGVTGIRGAIPDIPGTDAANARALLETIKAKAGFNYLQSMREASKTGGAVGNVSDYEQKLLQNAITALGTAQDKESFQRNLDRLIEYAQQSRSRIRNAYQDMGAGGPGRPMSPSPYPAQAQPQQDKGNPPGRPGSHAGEKATNNRTGAVWTWNGQAWE